MHDGTHSLYHFMYLPTADTQLTHLLKCNVFRGESYLKSRGDVSVLLFFTDTLVLLYLCVLKSCEDGLVVFPDTPINFYPVSV